MSVVTCIVGANGSGGARTGGGVLKPQADACAPPSSSAASEGAPLLAASTLSGTRCGGSTARQGQGWGQGQGDGKATP